MRGNGTGQAKNETLYTYDALNRLITAHDNYGNSTRTYTYDSLGNLTYETGVGSHNCDYIYNNLNQQIDRSSDNWKSHTTSAYDKRGNLILEEYIKNSKVTTAGAYTYDETNKMVRGVNGNAEESIYTYNGLGALMEQTWIIAKNGYGYHDVDATETASVGANALTATLVTYGNNGNGNNGNNGNGNGNQDKPTGSDVKNTSTVVKQFVVDFSSETYKPLMEHEVNGLDYRYVYSDKARLSVVVQGIENGSASLLDDAGELHAYYHCDYLGTTDYLTSAVNSKVISWTSYSEWGEITHNAVLKCGQRELDLVKEYATHDFDAVLNMYYAKARFYDADNRRFAAVDPILEPSQYDISQYATDPMQLVQYLYVKDNAVNWIDPLGLEYVLLSDIAEKYGALPSDIVAYDATWWSSAYTTVTINGVTQKYTASRYDFDNAKSINGELYVDDAHFMKQWNIYEGGDSYGIITQSEMNAYGQKKMAPAAYTYLMRLTYAWYLSDSASEQAILLKEANWFRGTGYSEIYFDSILCINENEFNEYIEFMPSIPRSKSMSSEQHYFRNDINIEYSWDTIQKLTSESIPVAIRWKKASDKDSALHQNNTNGGANTKWLSGDNRFEVVFDAQHIVQNAINNPEDMGTYNFGNDMGIEHVDYDVAPWLWYGNAENDSTEIIDRLGSSVAGLIDKLS